MDDKELIKRIIVEVKDEKLREELLALVLEKNRRWEEEPGGATGEVFKVGWWIIYILSIAFMLGSLGPLGIIAYLFTPAEERNRSAEFLLIFFSVLFISVLFILGLGGYFTFRRGKKEYHNKSETYRAFFSPSPQLDDLLPSHQQNERVKRK
jgi:hypothetical protein